VRALARCGYRVRSTEHSGGREPNRDQAGFPVDPVPSDGEQIGIWSNQLDLIEASARTASGKRLFIELRGGRISGPNLEGLAFVH